METERSENEALWVFIQLKNPSHSWMTFMKPWLFGAVWMEVQVMNDEYPRPAWISMQVALVS